MNTKTLFFFCFLCALLLISAVATEPSKDGTQAKESETQAGLDDWGRDGGGGWGHGGGGQGGGWGHGGGGYGGGGHDGGWGHGGGCSCCGRMGCPCC